MPCNVYLILPMTSLKGIPNSFKSFTSLQVWEVGVELQVTLSIIKSIKKNISFGCKNTRKLLRPKKQKELEQQKAEQAKQKASSDAHRSAITMLKAQFGDDYVDNILEDDANDHDQETDHNHDPDIITSIPTDNSVSLNAPPTVSLVVSTLLTTTQNITASNVESKFDKADDFAIL